MNSGIVTTNGFISWLKTYSGRINITEKAEKYSREMLGDHQFPLIKNVKEVLFPSYDRVYQYRWDQKGWKLNDLAVPATPTLLVALPCEARAIFEVLDRVFRKEDSIDSGYQQRRQDLSLVIFGCTAAPEPTCFCTRVGGNGLWTHPEALFVLPVSSGLYIETENTVFSGLMNEAKPVEEATRKQIQELNKKAQEKMREDTLPQETPQALYDLFHDPEWENIAWKCLNCGACTFLCPTCYCFDLSTEGRLKGYQLKTWDACMFPKFTLHASGHNPRPGYKERVRQRVLHKFAYFPLREEGRYGCVGCGKCVEICPVNWDIRDVVERMVKKIGSGTR
ncbi:MAG: 4Fe-4S dicluster domain-containing protein [Candidatus Atribacteria bacterium]|nr:4Fe-4S dicluster domain-containing protein [Candidatus Atribacteria bacterium]